MSIQLTYIEEIADNNYEVENKQKADDMTDFDLAYYSLDSAKMWTLKCSGRVVEKVIYEYAKNLSYESYLHSFIINDTDKKTKSLFKMMSGKKYFLLIVKRHQKLISQSLIL